MAKNLSIGRRLFATYLTAAVVAGAAFSIFLPLHEWLSAARELVSRQLVSNQQPRGHQYGDSEFEIERPISEFDEIGRMTLRLRKTQPIHFLGLPMRQIPTDNWLMSELIYKIQPDYIVEAGTLYGGSAVYYAAILDLVNPSGKVLTIDIDEEQLSEQARAHPLWNQRVEFLKGSSVAPEIHELLRATIGDRKKVLVTLDTLHAPNHVRQELELFSRYVSSGSYMILQDTYYEGLPQVIDDFLIHHPEWQRDAKLDERFLFTKYRGGFLQKK